MKQLNNSENYLVSLSAQDRNIISAALNVLYVERSASIPASLKVSLWESQLKPILDLQCEFFDLK